MSDGLTEPSSGPGKHTGKRAKPFQTKKYKGKGSKAEASLKLKEKHGNLKGGVWEEDEAKHLERLLSEGNTDLNELAEIFSRSVRVIRRRLKRISLRVADERSLEDAAVFTGLDVEGIRKMVVNRDKREKKKMDKESNKTLPPKDAVIELLSDIRNQLDRLLRAVCPREPRLVDAPEP